MSFSLNKEIKSYTELCKQNEHTTLKLCTFFKTFAQSGMKFLEKSKKMLEEYQVELRKEPSTTTNNISFLGLTGDLNKYLDNFRKIFSSIDKNIADKLSDYLKKLHDNHTNALSKLSKMSSEILENKSRTFILIHRIFCIKCYIIYYFESAYA